MAGFGTICDPAYPPCAHPEIYGTLHGFPLAGMVGMGRFRGLGQQSTLTPEEERRLADLVARDCQRDASMRCVQTYAGNNVPVLESRPEPGKPERVLPGYVPKLPSDPHGLTWQDKAAASSTGWQPEALGQKNTALWIAGALFLAWRFLR